MTEFTPSYLLNAALFAAVGVILFVAAFGAVRRMMPFDVWREIGENRNQAAAIVLGALAIAVSIIIASAVH